MRGQPLDRVTRSLIALGIAVCGVAAAGCEEQSSSRLADVVNAWGQAGLTPQSFAPPSKLPEGMDKGQCQQGTVNGIEATVCRFPDPVQARAARQGGLALIGEVTGVALDTGPFLLVIADRDNTDPAGRTINTMVRTFREKAAAISQISVSKGEGSDTQGTDTPKDGKAPAASPATPGDGKQGDSAKSSATKK